ncbi:chemotaxis protein CheC [Methanocaldococcus infernus]|uniref:CheC, inhibitor of MCP methylation n=1 Tax=Methanocaldococcus infernus (strain DSM 11812 / JCM 15783 / ME) TaxID=573063 RepID=D5VRJ7_METIM|nr:chemotaxis protein CheC [Methanocaldococcus infernus]ADG13200.1 CheC, inhibitor of MCP methylation [Methanocaldococcus infernus ME]
MSLLKPIFKLIEISKEAVSNMEGAFSELTGENVNIFFLGLRFALIDFVPEQFGEEFYKSVRIDFNGALSGKSLILIPEKDAVKLEKLLLVDILWDSLVHKSDLPDYEELESSLIGEVGNIVVSAFLNVFANKLKDEINITPPEFIKDVGFSIVESVIAEISEKSDVVMLFDIKVEIIGKFPIKCYLLILIDPDSLSKLDKLFT